MFDLDSKIGFDKATKFYEYAKSLAILRENYMRYRATGSSEIPKQIDDAIEILIKQVQLGKNKILDVGIEPMSGEDSYIIRLKGNYGTSGETKLKISGALLESLEQVK